jgi:8-oxo-dGTP pyrophosphatase MutT (NUDIX family)
MIVITDRNGQEWQFEESQAIYRKSNYGLVFQKDQVLLIKDVRTNKWEVPGGGVDEGETDEEGLIREMKEETGLDADLSVMKLIERVEGYYKPLNKDLPWKTDRNYYLIGIKDPNGQILLEGNGDDIAQCQWVDIDNLDSLEIDPVDYKVIKKALHL